MAFFFRNDSILVVFNRMDCNICQVAIPAKAVSFLRSQLKLLLCESVTCEAFSHTD